MKKVLVLLGMVLGMIVLQGCSEAQGMAVVKARFPGASITSRFDVDNLLPRYTYIVITSNQVLLVYDRGILSISDSIKDGCVTVDNFRVIKE